MAVAEALAWPLASILTLKVFAPPVKVALGPLAGAVKLTTPPLTGSPEALLTVATKGEAKAALITALCPEPLVAPMLKPRDSKAPISTVPFAMRAKPVPR